MIKLLEICITVVLCTLAYFALRRVRRTTQKLHIQFLCDLMRIVVFLIGIFLVLSFVFDIDRAAQTILTSGGIFLAVLTFAAQKVLNNTLSGFAISTSHPFEIGQKIKVLQGGSVVAEGVVKAITLRHTVVDTFDGQSCIIPNGIISESVIVNTNYTEKVGNFLEIEVGYSSDLDRAIEIMDATISAEPLVISHTKPLVSKYMPEGVILKTTVWTKNLDDNFTSCGHIRKELVKNFRASGITIPYPTVTIDAPKETSPEA